MSKSKKSNAARRDTHSPTQLVELGSLSELQAPPPPEGIRAELVTWWNAYFQSDIARAVYRSSDLPALERLVSLYELRAVAFELGVAEPIVRGGNNQKTENPMLKALTRYDADITQLEDRFGLTPRARVNLGIQVGTATKALEDMLPVPVEASSEVVDPRDVVDV